MPDEGRELAQRGSHHQASIRLHYRMNELSRSILISSATRTRAQRMAWDIKSIRQARDMITRTGTVRVSVLAGMLTVIA